MDGTMFAVAEAHVVVASHRSEVVWLSVAHTVPTTHDGRVRVYARRTASTPPPEILVYYYN